MLFGVLYVYKNYFLKGAIGSIKISELQTIKMLIPYHTSHNQLNTNKFAPLVYEFHLTQTLICPQVVFKLKREDINIACLLNRES